MNPTARASQLPDWRVQLDPGRTDATRPPTNVRIQRFAEGNDPQLAALYYHDGRCLLIGSSRPGGQPDNLQGIWNAGLTPPGQSKCPISRPADSRLKPGVEVWQNSEPERTTKPL